MFSHPWHVPAGRSSLGRHSPNCWYALCSAVELRSSVDWPKGLLTEHIPVQKPPSAQSLRECLHSHFLPWLQPQGTVCNRQTSWCLLRDKRICMGFPLLCQGIADLGASHVLAAVLCFWTHWSSKDQSPEFMWDLVKTLFWTQITLKSVFALISKLIQFSFKKAKPKPWLPGSWSGRLLCAWPQTGGCSRFYNMWCLVLHQVMDGGFCWFPPGQGILEPSVLRCPYGCRTERDTDFCIASVGWFWDPVDNYSSPRFSRLSLEPGEVVVKNLLSLFVLTELSGGNFKLFHFPSSPLSHAFSNVVP